MLVLRRNEVSDARRQSLIRCLNHIVFSCAQIVASNQRHTHMHRNSCERDLKTDAWLQTLYVHTLCGMGYLIARASNSKFFLHVHCVCPHHTIIVEDSVLSKPHMVYTGMQALIEQTGCTSCLSTHIEVHQMKCSSSMSTNTPIQRWEFLELRRVIYPLKQ